MRRVLGRLTAAAVAALLAIPASAQVVEYYHLDAVGNVRAVSNQDGDLIERHDYYPYGEEWCPDNSGPCTTPPSGQARRFTGKERDAESGMDYFGARYHASRLARFSSIDPGMNIGRNVRDPQLWNRYAYVHNNPIARIDPDGREDFKAEWQAERARLIQLHGEQPLTPEQRKTDQIIATAIAVPLLVLAAPAIIEVGTAVAVEATIFGGTCLASAGCMGVVQDLADSAAGTTTPRLSPAQAASLTRFAKKLPVGNTGTYVDELAEGVMFTAEVPGKVAGSRAVYQKAVDAAGETTDYLKTTFDPAGNVVHIKDKMTPQLPE